MFFFGQFDLLKRFLAAMRVTFIPMIAQMAATILHVPLCYFFVHHQSMGIKGLGLATTVTNFNLLLITMVYCNCSSQIRPALGNLNL